ncbi:MAG TPA: transposase [Lactovum miscens]|uniref:transposase n=1 Tax=Lactovum miscens TaxID=190387 RepID=UPI002ED8AFAF
MKNFFIGIDYSKLKFDVAIYSAQTKRIIATQFFENQENAFQEFTTWVKSFCGKNKNNLLFCGEDTGLYSLSLSIYLTEQKYFVWQESALKTFKSQGLKREKNDAVDAAFLAEYAYRYEDKAVRYELLSPVLDEIQVLLKYRDRLTKQKVAIEISCKEIKSVKQKNPSLSFMCEDTQSHIVELNKSITECEKRIVKLIKSDKELNDNYELICSIKGISLINAVTVLSLTNNFTLFTDPRKYACYCGVVPFKYSSGTSILGRTKISKYADKNLKTLLTMAARNSIRYDPEMKAYYERKVAEGKIKKVVLNNVRNKLIHRIFAVVKNKEKYNLHYSNPLKRVA